MTNKDMPRIPPITSGEITPGAADFFAMIDGPGGRAKGSRLNITRTMAHNPELAKSYFTFGRYIINSTKLSPRLRELATLRTAALYDSEYEWTKHERTALKIGMTQAEVDAVRIGPQWPDWSPLEVALLTATDQIVRENRIEDAVWQVIAGELDYQEQLDFVFVVGSYAMLAMALSALKVQVEPGPV